MLHKSEPVTAVYGEQQYLRKCVEYVVFQAIKRNYDWLRAKNDGELYIKLKLVAANMRNTLPLLANIL